MSMPRAPSPATRSKAFLLAQSFAASLLIGATDSFSEASKTFRPLERIAELAISLLRLLPRVIGYQSLADCSGNSAARWHRRCASPFLVGRRRNAAFAMEQMELSRHVLRISAEIVCMLCIRHPSDASHKSSKLAAQVFQEVLFLCRTPPLTTPFTLALLIFL